MNFVSCSYATTIDVSCKGLIDCLRSVTYISYLCVYPSLLHPILSNKFGMLNRYCLFLTLNVLWQTVGVDDLLHRSVVRNKEMVTHENHK